MIKCLKSSGPYGFTGVSSNTNKISPSNFNTLTTNLAIVKNCENGNILKKQNPNQKFERAVVGIGTG